jgi:SNF2 family DNA or RNA helicase
MRVGSGTRYFNEIVGYKNEEHLFKKLHDIGWIFKKTDEVISLPEMNFNEVKIPMSKEYRRFKIDKVLVKDELELVGDTPMKRFLYFRMLSGMYSKAKLQAVEDLLSSTDERVIIFYNFIEECNQLEDICKKLGKPIAYMNGSNKDMSAYEEHEDAVILIQYQSGSFGLNLQKCCHTVYFTPPLSTEQYEQSKARTRRIGQSKPCFYYNLIMKGSIEEKIYEVLAKRQNFTDSLFCELEADGNV